MDIGDFSGGTMAEAQYLSFPSSAEDKSGGAISPLFLASSWNSKSKIKLSP
jgi:hypothetical protein